MEILVIWVVVAIVGAIIAGNKGRSKANWFFLCVVLTPLAILVLLALPSLKEPSQFEAEALYKGTPYRPKAGGRIEAMLPGGDVVFHNMEDFTTAIDGGTIQLRGGERQSASQSGGSPGQTATYPAWAVTLMWGVVVFFATTLVVKALLR